MSDAIEVIKYKGFEIEVHYDIEPDNPRNWDNAGHMVCWHRRMTLGDQQPECSPTEWFVNWLIREGIAEELPDDELMIKAPSGKPMHPQKLFEVYNLLIPIMAYEHGGITIRANDYGNFPDQQWDCGQLGFIYISFDEIVKEWMDGDISRPISDEAMEKARHCLLAEIEIYDWYLTGEVYGYVMRDPAGDVLDSVWGFYGDEAKKEMIEECKSLVDWRASKKFAVQRLGRGLGKAAAEARKAIGLFRKEISDAL